MMIRYFQIKYYYSPDRFVLKMTYRLTFLVMGNFLICFIVLVELTVIFLCKHSFICNPLRSFHFSLHF